MFGDLGVFDRRLVQIVEASTRRVGPSPGFNALAGGTAAVHSDSGEVRNRKLPCEPIHETTFHVGSIHQSLALGDQSVIGHETPWGRTGLTPLKALSLSW